MTLAELRKKRGEPVLPPDVHDAHEGKHPGPLEYAQIGAILTVITMIEVGIYYIDMSHTVLVVILMGLSLVKFSMVVLWFMHLKFDNRLFSSMFLLGLFLAMSIFVAAMSTIGAKLV